MADKRADFATALRGLLRPGATIALGDGVGQLTEVDGVALGSALSDAAREVGDVRLILGWLPKPAAALEPDAFVDVVAVMPGWGVRSILDSGAARFVPTRLASVPALLAGPLAPDLLITRVAKRGDGLRLTTEVSWQRELIESGVPTLAVIDDTAPTADAAVPLPDHVLVAGRCSEGLAHHPVAEPEPQHQTLADAVLRFIEPGTRLQYGPGQLGTALLRQAAVPLRIDTGLLTDAVVDLDSRGLLLGTPSATYLLGSEKLYEWADGRPILRGIPHTHDLTRLSRGEPFVAVNTALEIDPHGQINVEGIGDKIVGGIGGHPDYCAAASMNPRGLSIIAVPSRTNGKSPLVQQLSRPVSTPGYDVDVIVTDAGHADLRGMDWNHRRQAITALFERGE